MQLSALDNQYPAGLTMRISSPTPSPTPTSTPPPSGSGYTYAGCHIFPGTAGGSGGGWFDTDISTAPEDPNSAGRIQAYYDALAGGGVSQSFNVWTVNWSYGPFAEFVNWANQSTPLVPVNGNPHPISWKMPWNNSTFQLENPSGGDRHAIVIDRSNCTDYELFAAQWSGNSFNANGGRTWDLTKPFPVISTTWGSTAAGLPLLPLVLTPEDLSSGVLRHSLGFSAVGCENVTAISNNGGVAPAPYPPGKTCDYTGPTNEANSSLVFGSHIRLKASFDDSGFPREAKIVAEGLKHYGAYVFDLGCCNSFEAAEDLSGAATWTWADKTAIQSLTIQDFDVVAPNAM